MSMDIVAAEFGAIAANADLVARHSLDSGDDGGPYFTFTFGAQKPLALWQEIWMRLYENVDIGQHMKRTSIAVCSDEDTWDEHLQLFHFDPSVQVDAISVLPD